MRTWMVAPAFAAACAPAAVGEWTGEITGEGVFGTSPAEIPASMSVQLDCREVELLTNIYYTGCMFDCGGCQFTAQLGAFASIGVPGVWSAGGACRGNTLEASTTSLVDVALSTTPDVLVAEILLTAGSPSTIEVALGGAPFDDYGSCEPSDVCWRYQLSGEVTRSW